MLTEYAPIWSSGRYAHTNLDPYNVKKTTVTVKSSVGFWGRCVMAQSLLVFLCRQFRVLLPLTWSLFVGSLKTLSFSWSPTCACARERDERGVSRCKRMSGQRQSYTQVLYSSELHPSISWKYLAWGADRKWTNTWEWSSLENTYEKHWK